MSTEVEGSSGLTPGVESHQNKPEEPVHPAPEQSQRLPDRALDGPGCSGAPVDLNKRCKENDKENEQNPRSGNVEVGETAREKVLDAPPPKVNAWAKRTPGRVPHNPATLGPHEKGNDPCI